MISTRAYFGEWYGSPIVTPLLQSNAMRLISSVNKLELMMLQAKIKMPINLKTKNQISGDKLGGFRPLGNGVGAGNKSSHCEARGIDLYDPVQAQGKWCMANLKKLEECGLYMEHISATPTWLHLTTRAPRSGKRCFYP